MTKQILEGLFESRVRVRVLRFLFRNYPNFSSLSMIAKHIQSNTREVKRELIRLSEIGLVREKTIRVKKEF